MGDGLDGELPLKDLRYLLKELTAERGIEEVEHDIAQPVA